MKELQSLKNLFHVAFDLRDIELYFGILEQTRQIVIHIFEYHIDGTFRHDNFNKSNNVSVP